MGAALAAYRRYRELQAGAHGRLTEVVDERWIENCVGLTGWTAGLVVATANFAAGIAHAFSGLDVKELDVVEKDATLVTRGQPTAIHSGAFLGVQPTGKRWRGTVSTCIVSESMGESTGISL